VNKPRIYSVDYYDFSTALKAAGNAGHKIEKSDKQRWGDYVRSNKIPEAAMTKRGEAEGVGGRLKFVIIDNDGEWDGYYVYSTDDQFSVKYDLGKD
jgi:hypothetical protein